jgi:hypothetical protein
MTRPVKLTTAQARALDWLPGNGAWRGDYPRGRQNACTHLWAKDLAEFDWIWKSPTYGHCRLNERGLALRASRQPPQSPQKPAEAPAATATPTDASGASCGALRGNLEGGT